MSSPRELIMSSPPETELRGRRHDELASAQLGALSVGAGLAPAQLGAAATSKSLPLAK